MNDCHECVLRVSLDDLGCPTYRANAARLRLANGSLLPFLSKRVAAIRLYTVSMAARTVFVGASFCLQEAAVALDNWCTWLDLWSCFMSVLSRTNSPRLIWQVCESVLFPLFTGWLPRCWDFDCNWRWHLFSSNQFTLQLFINKCKIRASSAGSSSTRASNIGNGATCHCRTKRPPRRVSSRVAPSNRRKLCLPVWMNVSMPLSITLDTLRIGRFTSTTVKPTRSSSP